MAIIMHGSWTLRVSSKTSGSIKRFVVAGADSGNGSYDGSNGSAVFVTGRQWSVRLEHRPAGQPWRQAAPRIGFPLIADGRVRVEISAEGVDADDLLVLGCSLPASSADTIVYGTARSYSGSGLFNPARNDLIVIDPPAPVAELCRRFPALYPVIDKLYPERLRLFPRHDPASGLTPLVLPTGLPAQAQGLVLHSQAPAAAAAALLASSHDPEQAEALAVAALGTTVQRSAGAHALGAGLRRLRRADLEALAQLRDAGLRRSCELRPAAGQLLRIQRYERSSVESLGGPYTGSGTREYLGFAVADEQGHYLLRFSHDAEIRTADAADDEALAAGLRPDLIVQALDTGLAPCWESAPYASVPNLQRIDLCIPYAAAHPGRVGSTSGSLRRSHEAWAHAGVAGTHKPGGDARIGGRSANAPRVDCAA
ncbi:hypothetical protein CLD22_12715 [Rubrivivax gelatinosus]|nr:hypothetical protein [Rubrivivax gelatinosus]